MNRTWHTRYTLTCSSCHFDQFVSSSLQHCMDDCVCPTNPFTTRSKKSQSIKHALLDRKCSFNTTSSSCRIKMSLSYWSAGSHRIDTRFAGRHVRTTQICPRHHPRRSTQQTQTSSSNSQRSHWFQNVENSPLRHRTSIFADVHRIVDGCCLQKSKSVLYSLSESRHQRDELKFPLGNTLHVSD